MRPMIVVLVMIALVLAACGSSGSAAPAPEVTPTATPAPPDDHADAQAALDAARAAWAAQGGADYDMRFNWQCFCLPDYVAVVDLEVRGGALVAGTAADDGTPLAAERLAQLPTIEQLFDLLQEAIDQGAARIDVTYAPEGYPAEAYIDYDERLADEERGFTVHTLALR